MMHDPASPGLVAHVGRARDDRGPPARRALVYDRGDMSEAVVVTPTAPVDRSPALVALDSEAPRLEDLFTFMVDAELRVQRLRMRLEERVGTAKGEDLGTIELILKHPGRARITTRLESDPLSRAYRVWASDGEVVTTYDALDERASVRPVRPGPVGAMDPTKPRFAQVRAPLTSLPAGSVVDTMIHPHGLIRNVLLTGPVALVGTTHIAGGRETLVLRAEHPRSAHVLTDRPDRWLEVGVDRLTGFITLLAEHIGDRTTRHAQVISLEVDGVVPDEAFTVHLPSDVRMIF
jgi:hypothetical protein